MNIRIAITGLLLLTVVGIYLFLNSQPDSVQAPVLVASTTETYSIIIPVSAGESAASTTRTSTSTFIKTTPTPATKPTTPASIPNGYSMAQVKIHNSESSCYAAINGNVYDLTAWIRKHPGGQSAILKICGTDATEVFNNQHGGQVRKESELATHKIGVILK